MTTTAKSYWFVGASYGKGSEDQSERFLKEGIWQNGYKDKYLDLVRSMQPGDRIAIKSSYTRKRNLPFESKGQTASVLGIKVIGVVTKNHGDGRFVDVDWEPGLEPVKEWCFYTNRSTIWKVEPEDWMTEGLINFTLGWNPDINDGVRLNIRPFLTVTDVSKKGAGILRAKPNIHWKKDRDKDVEAASGYKLGLEYEGKEGDCINS